MSDTKINTNDPEKGQAKHKKRASRKGHTLIPPKSPKRDAVVLLYRCRVISASEACEMIGIKRTAFYAMLQSRYGFRAGSFDIVNNEHALTEVEKYIYEMAEDQCKSAVMLMDWLEAYGQGDPEEFEPVEGMRGKMTRDDLMVLDKRFRSLALRQAYTMGYQEGSHKGNEKFDTEKWLAEEIHPENTGDPMVKMFLEDIEYAPAEEEVE